MSKLVDAIKDLCLEKGIDDNVIFDALRRHLLRLTKRIITRARTTLRMCLFQ